jgi:rubrerythrin
MNDEKPVLHLLKGETVHAEKLSKMYEKLTGKQISDEGKAQYREALDAQAVLALSMWETHS